MSMKTDKTLCLFAMPWICGLHHEDGQDGPLCCGAVGSRTARYERHYDTLKTI